MSSVIVFEPDVASVPNWTVARGSATRSASWRVLSVRLLIAAVALRVILSPLQHTWDSQTWWNVAAELGAEANVVRAVEIPYERMRQLTDLVRGSGQRQYYEYWAYPPAMLVAWWPVARAWTLVAGPLQERFAAPDSLTALALPPVLALGMKLPVILADLAVATLLSRLGHPRLGRWYLFNPFVLLVGVWTFDAVMLALLLGGLLAAERGRWGLSGVFLGLGGAVKFVPLLLVPIVALWALRNARSPLRASGLVVLGGSAAFGGVCLPWFDAVLQVLDFHGARPGGGMSWQAIWSALAWIDPFFDLSPITLFLSAQIGFLTLGGSLLLVTWLAWRCGFGLLEASLAILLAYLVGSKLVNEVYPLPAVAVLAVVLARRPWAHGRMLLRLLWVVPLLFAAVNVPAWGFLLAPAQVAGMLTLEDAQAFHAGYALTYQYLTPVLALVGATFQIMCAWGIWCLTRRPAAMKFEAMENSCWLI